MSSAKSVAEQLSNFFLQGGYYEDVAATAPIQPAATDRDKPISSGELGGFAGLAVRGVGYSDFDTEIGDKRPTCYIYVTRASRTKEKEIEREIGEVQIRLKKVGRVVIRPELASSSTNLGHSWRLGKKITCGSSIGLAGEQSAGTLGALLRGKGDNIFCLSNNHVFGGCNHTPKGQPILAPSVIDVRPGGTIEQIALFETLDELRSGDIVHVPTQRIDAAIAYVPDASKVTSRQGQWYETPAQVRIPHLGERVKKVGRTTALTAGTVESRIPALLPLPYKGRKFAATVNFADVWTIRGDSTLPFALPGDSGSLVVTEDESASIGLLFAVSGDGEVAWIASLPEVFARFNGYSLASGI